MKINQRLTSIVVIVSLLASNSLNGQRPLTMNLVIEIDDQILVDYIRPLIFLESGTAKISDTLEASYVPGELIVGHPPKVDVDSLLATLNFAIEMNGKFVDYSIPIGYDWFESSYMILRIYNLNKRKYRKRFRPLHKGGSYTFELDYPGGSMIRVKE